MACRNMMRCCGRRQVVVLSCECWSWSWSPAVVLPSALTEAGSSPLLRFWKLTRARMLCCVQPVCRPICFLRSVAAHGCRPRFSLLLSSFRREVSFNGSSSPPRHSADFSFVFCLFFFYLRPSQLEFNLVVVLNSEPQLNSLLDNSSCGALVPRPSSSLTSRT